MEFNDCNNRLFGKEPKLIFTIQKFPQMVAVRAKKVVKAREKKVTLFVTASMFVIIFLKFLKLQVGHGVTRRSVVRHPCQSLSLQIRPSQSFYDMVIVWVSPHVAI